MRLLVLPVSASFSVLKYAMCIWYHIPIIIVSGLREPNLVEPQSLKCVKIYAASNKFLKTNPQKQRRYMIGQFFVR